jgi:hypothetical protein
MTTVLPPRRQRGVAMILVALSLVVLVGFVGLVVDLAHLLITKTELQNAADACALAAARELTGDANALVRAENAGITVGQRNNVNFQTAAVSIAPDDVTFSAALSPNSAYLSRLAGANPLTSKFAMCSPRRTGIAMWFMQVLGFGPQSVAAMGVATLAHSQTACTIPLGLCLNASPPAVCPDGSSPDIYGLCIGDWRGGKFAAGGGVNGAFNWLQYPDQANGTPGIVASLSGPGDCSVGVGGAPVPAENGNLGNGAAQAWNSRFGLYQGNSNNLPPPDFTGYAYTPTSWAPQRDALANFLARRGTDAPYQGAASGLSLPGGTKSLSSQQLAANGADRRLVTVPVVDCSAWSPTHQAQLLGLACVLMLAPVDTSGNATLEYRGLASLPGSPCASYGLAGGSSASGGLVPVLVQ